jgi:hypothetical protein
MNASAGQMKARLGLDVSQFETRARGAANTARQMGSQITRALDGSRGAARANAGAFDQLRASIDPAFAASQRFGDMQRQIAAFVDQGVVSQRTANTVLEQAASRFMGVATAAERAEQAQRQQAQAVAQASSSYQSLRASIDPVYASSKRYESAIETADAALKAKVITEQEHARVLQMAQQRYLSLTPAVAGATGGLARFTPQITNASFQVQDFAVQVASGQSALTAFTQQFPQLAGVMGFSGKLALIGAGLGTLVAVGAAVAPMLLNMGNSADAAEDAIDRLQGAHDRLRTATDGLRMSTDDLTEKFGVNAGAARELYGVMADMARLEFAREMAGAVSALTGQFDGLGQQLATVTDLSRAAAENTLKFGTANDRLKQAVSELTAQYGLGYGQLVDLNRAMDELQAAKGPQEQARAAAELVAELRAAETAGARIPPQIYEAAIQLGNASMLGFELGGSLDGAASAADSAAAAARRLGAALLAAAGFSAGIEGQIHVIGARIRAQQAGADAALAGTIAQHKAEAAMHRDRQIADGMDRYNAEALYKLDMDRIDQLAAMTSTEKELAKAARSTGSARTGAASSASKAAKEAARLTGKLDKEAERWRDMLDPVAKYRREMSELSKLSGRLSQGEMAEAQRRLNVELADSVPLAGDLADTLSEGLLSGFSGTIDRIKSMFKRWLSEMIATALKNRIVVNMGASFGGIGGMVGGGDALSRALGAAGAPVGGGGILGGITSGLSAFGGGLWGGASSVISGLAGGGLSGGVGAIGSALSGATSGLAGLGTAIGAIALPVAAVAAVFSFFKTKTKQLDAGLRVTVDGMETLTQTFNKVEKKRFWGLSKSVRTYYEQADKATQRSIAQAVGTLQNGVLDAASVLGFGARTFEGFAHTLEVSTRGMSDEEALKAVQEAIAGLGDDFAGMVPGLARLRKDGEGASEAISRLAQSLIGVNGIMDTLGHRFHAVGLRGADMASQLADAFGGLDAMASATEQYYSAFYSEAERLRTTTRQTRTALAELGMMMPETRDEYRALVEGLDLTGRKGRDTYAALISLAGAFDMILPAAAGLTRQMETLRSRVLDQVGIVIDDLGEAVRANQSAAADWRKAGAGIRDYLDKLRGTASALISDQQARAWNQMKWMTTLASARAGDIEAAGNLTGAAGTYLSSVNDTARSRVEAALAQARVSVSLDKFADRTDRNADVLDRVADLQGRQVEILTQLQERIENGNDISSEGITRLLGRLGGVDDRIARLSGSAGIIVAGFNDALGETSITAELTGGSGLSKSMDVLRGVLGELRDAIRAETARKVHAKRVGRLNDYVGDLTANKAGKHFVDDTDLARMAKIAGIDTSGLSTNQVRRRLANFDDGDLLKGTVYDPTGKKEQAYLDRLNPKPKPSKVKKYDLSDYQISEMLSGSGRDHTGFRIRGPLGGAKILTGYYYPPKEVAENWIKRNNFPAFATGGMHGGGPAYVGERDLELVAPSRIYNPSETRKMLDNREVVQAIGKLWSEMKALREEHRQLAMATAENTRKMKGMLDKWDRTSVPTREVTP